MNLPTVLAHLRAHGIEPTKSLGQNFLTDLNVTHKIVRTAGTLKGYTVLEVGPGPGGLTRAILDQQPDRLISVEQDKRLAPLLNEISNLYPAFSVTFCDARTIDLTLLGPSPRKLIANLPYNVATPLTLGWLKQWRENPTAFSSLTLMYQREVVDRLVARPRTKAYGRLSVMAQWICKVTSAFELPPHLFLPPPKVFSSVAHFQRHESIKGDFGKMERVVATAFGQRRKTLKRAMKGNYPQIEEILADLNISPTARAEELCVEEFVALAQSL